MELNSIWFANRCYYLLTFSPGQVCKKDAVFLATDPDFENAVPCECPRAPSAALPCLILVHSSQCHWPNAGNAGNSDHSCRYWAREGFKWLLSLLINISLLDYFLLDFPVSTMSHIFRGPSNIHRNAVPGWIAPQLVSKHNNIVLFSQS